VKKKQTKKSNKYLNEVVTMRKLYEFTEKVIFPGVERIVDKRFKKSDEKFEKIDEKFEKIDERFEKIDEKLKDHDEKFKKLFINQDKIIGLLEREKMEEAAHNGLHFNVGNMLADHEKRIKKIELKLK
jgi:Na+/phosphate symporter